MTRKRNPKEKDTKKRLPSPVFAHERLQMLLDEHRMSVPTLADKMKVSRQLSYRYISGEALPTINCLVVLCDVFDVEMSFFFPSTRKAQPEPETVMA